MPQTKDLLGVVVLAYGPPGVYRPLIEALVEQGVPGSAIALVQNPVDPSDPEPAPPAEGVTVLRMPRNLAYAGGMNSGIRHHLQRGVTRLLLCTQDVRLRDGAIDALLAAGERAPEYGVLAPVLWTRNEPDTIFSWGGRRGRRGAWVSHIRDAPPPAVDGIAPTDWADGAILLLRREMLERIGLLDESMFMYFEETELCLRAARSNFRIGVVSAAEAEQESGQAARPGFHAYLISRNGLEFARRASGALGVVATLRRSIVETVGLGMAYRSAGQTERRQTEVKLAGMWLGVLDFARGRVGPPPPRVSRLGGQSGPDAMAEQGLLIVNADDFGYDAHHTDAILECASTGRITSTTAMMFMADSDRAAERAAGLGVGIGLHLNLSEAFSDPATPADVRETQARLLRRFEGTHARRAHRWLYDPTIQRVVDRSLTQQLERFRELYGREPTHVDGHQHVHICPNVFLSRAIPTSVKWRRSLDRPSGPGRAQALRQRLLDRRPSTRWLFDIADVDPRTTHTRAVLERSRSAPVEVMAHPGFGHERERLDAPEWTRALAGLPLGSYADLAASTER